jgi:Flp pilus assembly protein TadG
MKLDGYLHTREHGQSVVLFVLFLTVLLGFAALVIEGGNAFFIKRDMQGTADAAAMAGVASVTTSRSNAELVATNYVETQNAEANADADEVVATGASSETCNGQTVPPYSVCVVAAQEQSNLFGSLLGEGGNTVRATAIGSVSQVENMAGWLPFGVMSDEYTSGTQISFRPGSVASAGSINTPAGDDCRFYGGNNVRDVIMGASRGGADACAIDVGQTIETQTGVTSGIVSQGFSTRIGSNRDSFEDVFEYDAARGRYIIKKSDSPRLGIVPLAEGGGGWPLSGGEEMTVSGYAFVYIGNRSDAPTYAAVSGNGNGLRIHLTPVDALLPEDWDTDFMEYTAGSRNIVVNRLVV